MKYDVYNQSGDKVKEVELNSAVFAVPIKQELIHQVLVAQEANARQVLAQTKTRGEVRGGGRKPWRQKGTGRARAGSIRSPLWKGGGVIFGPRSERNFAKKINKKMKKKALFMTLSDKAKDKHLILLDDLNMAEAKTKKFVEIFSNLFEKVIGSGNFLTDGSGDPLAHALSVLVPGRKAPVSDEASETSRYSLGDTPEPRQRKSVVNIKALVITPETDGSLIRASHNLPKVKVIRADSLNVKDILNYDWLLMLVGSLGVIEKTYLKKE